MAKPISTSFLQIEVRNEKLKDLSLIEYESLGSEIKLTFEYNKEFAEKYNLSWVCVLNLKDQLLQLNIIFQTGKLLDHLE